jgi:hypothetical protein
MLEQSLINPQFLGRDGFNWFIGQIVYNSKDSSKGARARVRILGLRMRIYLGHMY